MVVLLILHTYTYVTYLHVENVYFYKTWQHIIIFFISIIGLSKKKNSWSDKNYIILGHIILRDILLPTHLGILLSLSCGALTLIIFLNPPLNQLNELKKTFFCCLFLHTKAKN